MSTKSRERSIPSTNTKGLVFGPNVLIPRIQKSEPAPGSPERCTATIPAICPAKLLLICPTGTLKSLRDTVLIAPTTLSFFCLPNATTVISSNSLDFGLSLITKLVLLPTATI